MPASKGPSNDKEGPRRVCNLCDAQLERKRTKDREAQRIVRQQTKEHIENLKRQAAEPSEEKEQLDQALQRNSELEAQIATLQRQVTHMALLLQGRQSLVGPGHIGIVPAYSTNNYHAESSIKEKC